MKAVLVVAQDVVAFKEIQMTVDDVFHGHAASRRQGNRMLKQLYLGSRDLNGAACQLCSITLTSWIPLTCSSHLVSIASKNII